MLKVIELFAGIGSQTQALKNIDVEHEVIGISEIDKYAIKSYEAIHGSVNNFGDIKKIEKLPYCDLLTYSFPCFIEGTKVLTLNGYKNIEDINCSDEVLTHKNRYKKVVKPMINKANHIYKLSTMGSDDLFATEEHPFYVRKKYKIWNNHKRTYDRKFENPSWIKVKDLSKDFYVGIAINKKSELPNWTGSVFEWLDCRKNRYSNVLQEKFNMSEFWWIIGRYLGDGWIRHQSGIIICCDFPETNEITEKLEILNFNYSISSERTTNKIHISFKEIGEYVEQFGRGAKNKKLTGDIINLPVNLLKGFIEGYMSADGCFTQNLNKATSISNELIYGIGQCVAKVYNKPFSIYKTIRPKKTIIEGRLVNQNDTYSISWKNEIKKQDKAFYEDGYLWCPINNIEKLNYEGNVYNFEVEEDNSYVVQNIIVHNCQDISVAGKQEGIKEGTRSGLLLEVERIIEVMEEKPKYLLLENVKNLIGKGHKDDFDKWLKKLDKLGYYSYYKVLNAKNYGIPQNRDRVFVVSVRKDLDEDYYFPKAFDNGLRLKDMLETEVDEKYYISKEITEKLLKKVNENLNNLTNQDRYSILQSGMLDIKGNEQVRRVSSYKGINPTLNTMQGGNRQPKVMIKEATKQGYAVAEVGDSINIEHPNSLTRRGRVGKEVAQTLTTSPQQVTLVEVKTRKDIKEEEKYCKFCNEKLERKRFNGRLEDFGVFKKREYCSRECMRKDWLKIGDNHNQTYSNAHTTARKINELILKKENCEICGSKENLDIHHLDENWNNNNLDNLICLCRSCHMKEHHNKETEYKIRKLTPIEVWRLMGFKDEQFNKAKSSGMSDSQLYKQAGNSICVPVLEEIFKKLFK